MTSIPYEAQLQRDGDRTCAAAALIMVYSSFGITLPQEAVWRVVALPDGRKGLYARTNRLAFDAVARGLSAVTLKARDPIRAVREILTAGDRAIMNHRLTEDSWKGHYTVALSADDSAIVFHDPEFGPSQTRSTELMRELWTPKYSGCEITGNFLIALSNQSQSPCTCAACGASCPTAVQCCYCRLEVPLQPVAALGCTIPTCPSRLWELILCPYCDQLFTLSE